MTSTMNSLPVQQHQADPDRTVGHEPRGHREPHTRGDGTPTRWIRLAHTTLNQAKMASPRRVSASSSPSAPPTAPDPRRCPRAGGAPSRLSANLLTVR